MNDNIAQYLRTRVADLTTEVQCLVAQEEDENKPNERLIALLIAEIDDLQNQLEFVEWSAMQAQAVVDLTADDAPDEYFYEDNEAAAPSPPPPPPVLVRSVSDAD